MSLVCEAIRRRLLIEFEYNGLHRVVAPYCHGISTRNNETLRGVQVHGATRDGRLGFGKFWTISKIRNLRLRDEAFLPNDRNYNPDDKGMKQIHCRV